MKKVFLILGQSLLVTLGLLVVANLLFDAFESSLSFLEISTTEMIYFVLLFFLIKNHIEKSLMHSFHWKKVLYLPLRNLGWYGLTMVALSIFLTAATEGEKKFEFTYDHVFHLIDYAVIALCIYMATPKGVTGKQPNSSGKSES